MKHVDNKGIGNKDESGMQCKLHNYSFSYHISCNISSKGSGVCRESVKYTLKLN